MSFQAVWWILGRKEEDGHSFICPLHEILLWKPAEHWALFLCSSAGLFLLSWGHFLCPPLRALGFFGGILPAAEPARVRPPRAEGPSAGERGHESLLGVIQGAHGCREWLLGQAWPFICLNICINRCSSPHESLRLESNIRLPAVGWRR